MKKISFVIPCYKSTQTIGKVVDEIITTVQTRHQYDYEIILVNDCSPDDTDVTINALAQLNHKVTAINLAKNFGQHAALMAGFEFVSGQIIICLDDDGQTPPSELFKLVDELDNGSDVVFAKYDIKKHSGFRNLGSKLNDIMAEKLIGKPEGLTIMSYFACRRFVIDEIRKYKNPYPYVSGLLIRTTSRLSNVIVEHRNRTEGQSGYTVRKLLRLWLNGFTSFSVKPLRVASVTGFACALVGFAFSGVTIANKFLNPDAPIGYSSLMSVILFIGGIIMLMLGLIGEYIGRSFISLNNSPQYVIRPSVLHDSSGDPEVE